MKVITTINSKNVNFFLNSNADALMVGLDDWTTYLDETFSITEIKEILKNKNNKEIYVCINRIVEQHEINKVRDLIKELATFSIDGIVVMDMGILQIAKEEKLLDKIVFSPSTYLTNKDSAAYLSSLGIKRLVLAKEISLNNIFEIKKNVSSEVEITMYGYRNIFYSKRHVKSIYREAFEINDFEYLKEEKREDLFPIKETDKGTFVFSARPLSLWKYLPRMLENNIDYINVESNFLSEDELSDVIDSYKMAISLWNSDKFDNYINSVEFDNTDEGFINKDSVYMQEEY